MHRFNPRALLFALAPHAIAFKDDPDDPGTAPADDPAGGDDPPAPPAPKLPPRPSVDPERLKEKKELEQLRKYREDAEAARVAAEREKMTEADRLKSELEEERSARLAAEQRVKATTIGQALYQAAVDAGLRKPSLYLSLLSREGLSISEAGAVEGCDDAIEALRAADPSLFADPATPDDNDEPGERKPAVPHPDSGKTKPSDKGASRTTPLSDREQGRELAKKYSPNEKKFF